MPTRPVARTRLAADLRAAIRDVPDFPRAGILFKDVNPVFADAALFRRAVKALGAPARDEGATHVVGIESRGFILGAAVALMLDLPFVPVRKQGKLPGLTDSVSYSLEYGTAVLEIQQGALARGDRCLVVDDVLATGGTAAATRDLVRVSGAVVTSFGFLVALTFLDGERALRGEPVRSLVQY